MDTPNIVILDADSIGQDFPWPDFGALGNVTLYGHTDKDDVAGRLEKAHIALTNKVYLSARHIAEAPVLRYIGVLSTGYNQVSGESAAARGIPLCNVPDYSTPSVAQHVFALLLELCNHICLHASSVHVGEWSAKSPQSAHWKQSITELSGKKLGIVGFGNTGHAVGRIAHSLGMEVLAYAPHPKPKPDYAPFSFVDLPELFREADVVSLHCPLTQENKGMIDKKLLSSMKKSALLINTARGPLVNENDLVEALEAGDIAGAGLDVVSREPIPGDNPLRFAPNCVITPHIAWASREARIRLMRVTCDNIANFLRGTPTNVCNGV